MEEREDMSSLQAVWRRLALMRLLFPHICPGGISVRAWKHSKQQLLKPPEDVEAH